MNSNKTNITYLLDNLAYKLVNKKAIIYCSSLIENITFRQLKNRVDYVAMKLTNQGLHKGDKVLLILKPTTPDFYIFLLAIIKIGAIVILPSARKNLHLLLKNHKNIKPDVIISYSKILTFLYLLSDFRKIKKKISIDSGILFSKINALDKKAYRSIPIHPVAVNSNDAALITFTSGNTGKPKTIVRTHGNLLVQHKLLKRFLTYHQNDIDLGVMPLFTLNAIASGVTSVLLPNIEQIFHSDEAIMTLVRTIKKYKITVFGGSPAMIDCILQYCKSYKIKLSCIRGVVVGGAPVFTFLLKDIKTVMPAAEIEIFYGNTEVEPIATISTKDFIDKGIKPKGALVGKPIKEVKIKIVPLNKNSEIGNVFVYASHANQLYKGKLATNTNGLWLDTEDIGYFDNKGILWLVGRKDTVIYKNRQTIYPLLVQECIDKLSWVKRSAVVGIPSNTSDMRIVLFVSTYNSLPSNAYNEIENILSKNGFVVDEIKFLKELPMDSRHFAKIDYEKLRIYYQKNYFLRKLTNFYHESY